MLLPFQFTQLVDNHNCIFSSFKTDFPQMKCASHSSFLVHHAAGMRKALACMSCVPHLVGVGLGVGDYHPLLKPKLITSKKPLAMFGLTRRFPTTPDRVIASGPTLPTSSPSPQRLYINPNRPKQHYLNL